MKNTLKDLAYYTGTEQYHKLTILARFNCTDGIKYVADEAGAYWLVDAIASYQPKLRALEFQHWKLTLKDNSAVLTCTDGHSDKPIVKQKIGYTDFPQDIAMYLTNGVLMLTSEY